MKGMTVELVASSWIDVLGGLSRWYIFSTPPLFCASATPLEHTTAATKPPSRIIGRIVISSLSRRVSSRSVAGPVYIGEGNATGRTGPALRPLVPRRNVQSGRLGCPHRPRIARAHFASKAGHHALAQLDRRAGRRRRDHEVVEAERGELVDAPADRGRAADQVGVHERAELGGIGELAQVGEHTAEILVLGDVGPRIGVGLVVT